MESIVISLSALVNLALAESFIVLKNVVGLEFFVGDITLYEYGIYEDESDPVVRSVEEEFLKVLDGDKLFSSRLTELVGQHDISAGEAESILFSSDNDFKFCCDDTLLRLVASKFIPEANIITTAALMKIAVQQNKISAETALDSNRLIRDNGGFVEELQINYFRDLP